MVTQHFRTKSGVGLLRFENPDGGKVIDLYGGGKPVPPNVVRTLSSDRIKRLLDSGLIEMTDAGWNPTDPHRVIECWCALVSFDVPKDAGRPRAAEILRGHGCRYSNATIGAAVKLYNSDWKLGDPLPEFSEASL